ncbi:hypothetical protein C8J57DRAFT_1231984 [Mycena rebaudengoi]|nr:hypothetical protein C8J57DRAFT_1231984 [Mycena rebaudengoi]
MSRAPLHPPLWSQLGGTGAPPRSKLVQMYCLTSDIYIPVCAKRLLAMRARRLPTACRMPASGGCRTCDSARKTHCRRDAYRSAEDGLRVPAVFRLWRVSIGVSLVPGLKCSKTASKNQSFKSAIDLLLHPHRGLKCSKTASNQSLKPAIDFLLHP